MSVSQDPSSAVTAPSTTASEKPSILRKYSRGKSLFVVAAVLGVFLVAAGSFAGGLALGLHKARFSYQWGENYEQHFIQGFDRGHGDEDQRLGRMQSLLSGRTLKDWRAIEGRGYRNAHGLSGTVLSITGDTLVLADQDGQESSVVLRAETILKNGRETVAATSLMVGDRIVVIGKPGENGVVQAELVRIFGKTVNSVTPDTPDTGSVPGEGTAANGQ